MRLTFGKPALRVRPILWLGLIGLIAWGLRSIPIQSVWQTIQGLRLSAMMILVLVNSGLFLLFSSRWWLILWAQGYRVPFLALVGYRLAGFSLSYFTPGPQFGGEPLQVYLSRKHHQLPTDVAVASVTLDKLIELLVNFTFLATGIAITLQSGLLGELAVSQILWLAMGLLVFPAGYLAFLWIGWRPFTWLSRRLPRLAGKPFLVTLAQAETQIGQFCRQHPGPLLAALILSMIVWAGMILEYWLMLRFLGLTLSPAQTIIALTAARLAFLAPTPGGLGALEASQAFAIQALGFSPALGISATLLIRARDLAIGGLGLWQLGLANRGRRVVPAAIKIQE